MCCYCLCVFFSCLMSSASFWMMIMIILEWTLSIKLNCDEREEEVEACTVQLTFVELREFNFLKTSWSLLENKFLPCIAQYRICSLNYAPIKNKLCCICLQGAFSYVLLLSQFIRRRRLLRRKQANERTSPASVRWLMKFLFLSNII